MGDHSTWEHGPIETSVKMTGLLSAVAAIQMNMMKSASARRQLLAPAAKAWGESPRPSILGIGDAMQGS
jgi:hypothetical protein